MHRSEIEIDPKIGLVDTGSKNEIKVLRCCSYNLKKSGTHATPKIELSVTTVVEYHLSTSITEGTIVDSSKS